MQSYKATFLPTNSYCLFLTIDEKGFPKPLIQAFYHDQQAIITCNREYTIHFQNNKDVTVDKDESCHHNSSVATLKY